MRATSLHRLFLQHAPRPGFLQLRSELLSILFRLTNEAVANLRHTLQVAFAFFRLLFDLELLQLFFELSLARNQVLFLFPIAFRALDRSRISASSLSMTASRSRELDVFLLECLFLDLQLGGAPLQLIDSVGRESI